MLRLSAKSSEILPAERLHRCACASSARSSSPRTSLRAWDLLNSDPLNSLGANLSLECRGAYGLVVQGDA